jgi:hypothetical protein
LTRRGGGEKVNRNALVVIDLERDRRIDLPDAEYHRGLSRRFAFVPDGSVMVYACRTDTGEGLRLWDLRAERVVGEINDAKPPVVVAANGRALAFVATSQGRGMIRIAELPDLRTLAEFPTENERVTDLCISADGGRVAAVYYRPVGRLPPSWSVRCWDTTSGTELVSEPEASVMRLAADGETLVTYATPSSPRAKRLVAWDLSSGRPRWERELPNLGGANLNEVAVEPLRGCVTVVYAHDNPWNGIRDRVEKAGVKWPFSQQTVSLTSEMIDIESGRSVMSLPFALYGAFETAAGPIAVASTFDLKVDNAAPRVDVWDIPPRKSVTWFTAGAAMLAVPLFLIGRRRARRLPQEAAA